MNSNGIYLIGSNDIYCFWAIWDNKFEFIDWNDIYEKLEKYIIKEEHVKRIRY